MAENIFNPNALGLIFFYPFNNNLWGCNIIIEYYTNDTRIVDFDHLKKNKKYANKKRIYETYELITFYTSNI